MQSRKLLFLAAALAAFLPASPAGAQTIRAGMTEAQVRSTLGEPAATRRDDQGWTYLFYLNGCAVRCGSDDVVFLRDDRVVTAVFRTARRRFSGPAPASALESASETGGGTSSVPRPSASEPGEATVTGIRVTLPGSEDVTLGGGVPAAAPRGGIIVYGDTVASSPARADTLLDQARRDRERRVEPRTIRPRR